MSPSHSICGVIAAAGASSFWMIPVTLFTHEMKRSMRTSTSATPSSSRRSKTSCNRRILPLVRDAGDPARISAADHPRLCDRTRWVRPLPVHNPSHPVIHRRDQAGCAALNQPYRRQALQALEAWSQSPLGRNRPFDLIEQQRGGSKQRLSQAKRLNGKDVGSSINARRHETSTVRNTAGGAAVRHLGLGDQPRTLVQSACVRALCALGAASGVDWGAFERLWRPMGRGLKQVARQDANRLGSSPGSPPRSPRKRWSYSAGPVQRPTGSAARRPWADPVGARWDCGGAGRATHHLCVAPGTHGTNTTWLALPAGRHHHLGRASLSAPRPLGDR